MKINITTQKVREIYESLSNFVSKDEEIPAQAAWDLDYDIDELEKICTRFDNKQTEILQPLVDEKLVYEKEGNIFPVEGHEDEFKEKVKLINEFLSTENEINIKTISKNDLPDKFSIKDLRALKFLLKEDKESED